MKQKGFAQILIIILLLVVLGGVIYFGTKQGKVTTHAVQTPVPSATPDATANWKTYQTRDNSFTMNYPADWIIDDQSKQIDLYNDGKLEYQQNITFSKDGYSLNSYNPLAFGPTVCLFPDSPSFEGPSAKYTDFVEFSGTGGLYRRVKSETQDQTGKIKWFACRKDPNSQFFATLAGFGTATYETPLNFDSITLGIMDEILASITHLGK